MSWHAFSGAAFSLDAWSSLSWPLPILQLFRLQKEDSRHLVSNKETGKKGLGTVCHRRGRWARGWRSLGGERGLRKSDGPCGPSREGGHSMPLQKQKRRKKVHIWLCSWVASVGRNCASCNWDLNSLKHPVAQKADAVRGRCGGRLVLKRLTGGE